MKSSPNPDAILKVVEIFHSVQGEGRNVGRSAVFVRLTGCNMQCSFCDTDWSIGAEMTAGQILEEVKKLSSPEDYPNNLLIWTGGEPTLQLTAEIVDLFNQYYNCIETNGTNPVPHNIEYITCSPKVSPEVLKKNFKFVNEFRFPLAAGGTVPAIENLPPADNYFVSPIFVGTENECFQVDATNVNYCMDYVRQNPRWKMSVQMHKLLNVR